MKILVTGQSPLPIRQLALNLDRAGVPLVRALAPDDDASKKLNFETKKEVPGHLFDTEAICTTLVGCIKAPIDKLFYPI